MKGAVTSGEMIGEYRVLQTLGEGGMGVVHLGADPVGRNVAIKVLRPAVAGDATARRRLAREVDSMRRVHSPHVAEILDADVTAERPYIVTQYVPGRTLEEIVEERGPIDPAGLQRLALGLASALSAIHGAGIVHRDMKPGNVMLVDGEPVVIDFGIAQGADATRLTATGMVIGTPGYLAPEIIEGEDAGPPSDIHAWAGTVAYAATGRPPFGSGTFESIFYKIMSGTPDLDGVPAALLPMLRSAMARHPAERPTAVDLVQIARRIHIDSTITDGTRIDDHYPARNTAGPAETIVETGNDRPEAFAAPAPAPTLQPKDFRGLLPPVAPPPPVPPPGPAPHETGRQFGPSGTNPFDNPYNRSGYPPATAPTPPPQPPVPYDPYRPPQQPPPQPPPHQQRPGPHAGPEPERRKPFALYRVMSGLVLVALLGFARMTPVLAVLVTMTGVLVLRAADKAAKGMEDRRTRRGPRTGDAVGAAIRSPLHLPGAVLTTALLSGLSLFAGLVLLVVLMFVKPDMGASTATAYAAMLVILLLSLAPGSGAPRRQLARVWGALLPRSEVALGGTVVLGVFAAVLVVLSQGRPPDTTPVDGMSQSLDDLRGNVRDLVDGGIPFM
ncbi:serine/threonine-protein kinase [Actinomadura rayongensis]|uniref:Protein kinase n=1 Tax=Actinomadura rayongensis TaxID=1429076 RepID=A0A6I4VYI0_9ACTN|nr:serine/threonine-protein kinase [Actinomadura rayongensis]MXQ63409.1 protein kinase [Actinomadura rayongensis]